MKRIAILVACMWWGVCSAQTVQQEKAAHQAIKTFVAGKYPTAKMKMIIEETSTYKLRFKIDGHRYTSAFTSNGDWVKTEERIKQSEIPGNVKTCLDTTKYKNCKTYLVSEVNYAARPSRLFVIEVSLDTRDPDSKTSDPMVTEVHKLYFKPSGELVKDELEPEALPYLPFDNYLF